MFRCKWVNLSGGGVQVDPQYGMTIVDLNNLGYTDEPFVLANDVAQVFYVKNMSTKPRNRKDKEASVIKFFQGKETSWEWRTRQTSQKIMSEY